MSWLLAMTFIPMLTTRALQVAKTNNPAEEAFGNRWYGYYRSLLAMSLRHRTRFAMVVAGLFGLAIFALGFVRQEFIAPSEDPVFSAKF